MSKSNRLSGKQPEIESSQNNISYRPSTYIYFDEDVRATRITLPIYIGSIPVEFLDNFDAKLKSSLQRIVESGIDMSRMKMVINRDERQVGSIL